MFLPERVPNLNFLPQLLAVGLTTLLTIFATLLRAFRGLDSSFSFHFLISRNASERRRLRDLR